METRAKLLQVTKQKEGNERKLQNEITRLKLQNEKLTDRLRNKGKCEGFILVRNYNSIFF